MRALRWSTYLIAALAVLPTATLAQGTIRGVVRDSLKRPIANAEVVLVAPLRTTRTDSSGAFAFSELAPGKYELRARRLGYFPAETTVELVPRATRRVTFELDDRPALLDTVTVTAVCDRWEMNGFFCRRKKAAMGLNNGTFIDEEQIDASGAIMAGQIMSRVPNLHIKPPKGKNVRSLIGSRCLVQLVNGKLADLTKDPATKRGINELPFWSGEVIGIEYYADPDDVPPEYSQFVWGKAGAAHKYAARCSVKIWWTVMRIRYPAGSPPPKP